MNLHDLPIHLLCSAPPQLNSRQGPQNKTELRVSWARSESEVREAQRLRYQVFAVEMGVQLNRPAGAAQGLDVDVFDPFCEHLLVRAHDAEGEPGAVVGTYRVLTPEAARHAGGLYAETEFDLTRLRGLRSRMVEVGRSCVHADFRSGGVILALWGALTEFMGRNGLDTMIGCASVGMQDGGHVAASLWAQLSKQHLAPIDYRVRPRLPLPIDDLRQDLIVTPPALIRGYLRCGAKLLGEPAWDPDFRCADLPLMVRAADLPARFRRLFEGS
jgi:putative hemolysin